MDKQQNAQVERMARDAATGKQRYDWRKVPIGELPGAIASCPYRSRGLPIPSWWEKVEPGFLKKQGEGIARSVGLDRIAYCGEPVSESIAVTPDGFWIIRNTTIGRTGFQTYKVGEIADPEGLIGDDYSPEEELQLWRDPSEVFSPATLASFEGKSLTLGHPHDLLNPYTDTDHAVGHVQNVHKGREPLDSGDWPMLADLIVKDAEAIEALKSGECQLSCGYTYRLAKEGHRWDQREILGNHVAMVPRGRAGHEARVETAGVNDKRGRDRRSGQERENSAAR